MNLEPYSKKGQGCPPIDHLGFHMVPRRTSKKHALEIPMPHFSEQWGVQPPGFLVCFLVSFRQQQNTIRCWLHVGPSSPLIKATWALPEPVFDARWAGWPGHPCCSGNLWKSVGWFMLCFALFCHFNILAGLQKTKRTSRALVVVYCLPSGTPTWH